MTADAFAPAVSFIYEVLKSNVRRIADLRQRLCARKQYKGYSKG